MLVRAVFSCVGIWPWCWVNIRSWIVFLTSFVMWNTLCETLSLSPKVGVRSAYTLSSPDSQEVYVVCNYIRCCGNRGVAIWFWCIVGCNIRYIATYDLVILCHNVILHCLDLVLEFLTWDITVYIVVSYPRLSPLSPWRRFKVKCKKFGYSLRIVQNNWLSSYKT